MRPTVWFSRDELSFMIAATARALQEMEPDEFFTRAGRTVGYANTVLARLRVANGEGGLREEPYSPEGDDRTPRAPYNPRMPTSDQVVMKVERVDGDKALISLADHELCFLKNAINEVVHGLRGVEEFERSSGKTRKYGVRLMHQLRAANDRIEDLN